jgi:hypothetical protein
LKVTDGKITFFTVGLQLATNINVEIAKQTTNMSYTDVNTLTAGSTLNITCEVNDIFRITAINSGGTGVLVMTVASPPTGSGDPDDGFFIDNIAIILPFILFFVFSWTVLIIIMAILYGIKTQRIRKGYQQAANRNANANRPAPQERQGRRQEAAQNVVVK